MSVWYVICIILPCNQECTLCGRATGVSMPHDPPSSYERIRAAPRGSSPFPFVSVRCGANPLHVSSWHCLAIASLVYSFPPPVAACPFLLNSSPSNTGPFRFISRRGPSVRIVSLSVQRPSTRCLSFPSRSFAGLTRGAVSAYVGHSASLGRPPPTRSGPCRCCATGTDRAVRRSPAILARSPRPWGSSRGC